MRKFSKRDLGRPSLFDAVCDECGKNCQVPFKPSGDRPTYCRDCFEKKGGGGDSKSSRRSPRRQSFGGRDSRRPPQNNISDRNLSQLVEKIGDLNTKLDIIIGLLSLAEKKKSKPAKDKAGKSTSLGTKGLAL